MSQLEKWVKLATHWHDQGPPATPSPEDLDHFMAAVRRCPERRAPAVGVLGCTPSLRTRVRREFPDASVVLIDFCPEMFEMTSAVVPDDVRAGERYLAIDWLDMSAHITGETDVLIGDKSLDNVPIDQWADFFRATARALRPAGMLVLHVGIPDRDLAGKPFDMLASRWLRVMISEPESLSEIAAGLWEDLLSGSASNDTSYLSLEPYRSALRRHSAESSSLGTLSARVLADFAAKPDARWTKFERHDVISAAGEAGFVFEGEALSGDYAAARCQPILSFRTELREYSMKTREARWQSTSTSVERISLDAPINLADSHARVLSDNAIKSAFEQATLHFKIGSTASQVDLEQTFTSAFEELYNIRFPREPLLGYSSSSFAGLVGTLLGAGAWIAWPVPSFDNIRDMVRHAGVRIELIPEAIVRDLPDELGRQPRPDAIWLTLPNNPTGFTLGHDDYARLAGAAAREGVILIIDHCFRGYSPTLLGFDQYQVLEASGCGYIVLEDTGKTISTLDLKVGMLVASRDLHSRLRLLNEDLVLNVSPFILRVLTSIMRAWRERAGLRRLGQLIEDNRATIRAAYAGSSLVPRMRSTEIPVEWLDAGSCATARDLLDSCVTRGLRLLPGASFFGRPNESGSSLLRIALTRDAPVVSAAAEILGHALFSEKNG